MPTPDLKIGQRVRVLFNDMTALIVGRPEFYTRRSSLVRIKYENSTRFEQVMDNQIDLLPEPEQYPVHGGTYTRNQEV